MNIIVWSYAADKDGFGVAGFAAYYIKEVVHSITEVDVEVAAAGEHNTVARGFAAACVACGVAFAQVTLGFRYYGAEDFAVRAAADNLAKKRRGKRFRALGKEALREVHR